MEDDPRGGADVEFFLASLEIPDHDLSVITSASRRRAIRRHGHARGSKQTQLCAPQLAPARLVPDADWVTETGRNDPCAVGEKCGGLGRLLVSRERLGLAGRQVPNIDCPVMVCT